MRLLLILLIIISVTPWAYSQEGNSAEHWISGKDNISSTTQIGNYQDGEGNYGGQLQKGIWNDAIIFQSGNNNITNQTQKGIANFAVSTIFGSGNNSTIVQH